MTRRSGNPAKAGWEPLQIGAAPDDGKGVGMAGAFHRSGGERHWYVYRTSQRATACRVFRNRLYNGWALTFEDGSLHLTFKRNDRAAVRDWRHFQAIKNEVAGPEREALEIFPAESALVDGANEYHLWVLPEGAWSPLGLAERAVLPPDQEGVGAHDHARYRQTGQSGYAQRAWEPGIPTGLGRE